MQAITPMQNRQRPGTATYSNGQATAASILQAAERLIIEQGMTQLSMRGIARALNMSPGNLSYYYASKQDLIADLFMHVIEPYLVEFERLRHVDGRPPEAQLRAVMEFVFDDLGNQSTTYFFPEMWAMALRDDRVAEQMERMYAAYRSVLQDILVQLRPELDDTTIADLALTISATIEGFTVFTGYQRPHAKRAPHIRTLVIGQLVEMARSAPGKSS